MSATRNTTRETALPPHRSSKILVKYKTRDRTTRVCDVMTFKGFGTVRTSRVANDDFSCTAVMLGRAVRRIMIDVIFSVNIFYDDFCSCEERDNDGVCTRAAVDVKYPPVKNQYTSGVQKNRCVGDNVVYVNVF